MYAAIAPDHAAWDSILLISFSLMVELKVWYLNIDCFNGCSIRPPLASPITIFTDTSDVTLGFFLFQS